MFLPAARSAIGKKLAGSSLLAVAMGLGLVSRLAVPGGGGGAGWIGYRVVLVDSSIPEAEIISRLHAAGIDEVISESSEPVLVSDWARLTSSNLAEVKRRLLPGDPRLDEYIQNLSGWFLAHVGGIPYHTLYVKSSSLLNSGDSIARGLDAYRGKYYVPDDLRGESSRGFDALRFACAIALMLASSAATSITRRGSSSMGEVLLRKPGILALDRVALRFAAALPWAVLASVGSSAAVAALLGIAATEAAGSLELPLEELRRARWRGGRGARRAIDALIHQGRPHIAFAIVGCLSLVAVPFLILSAAISILGSIFAISGYALVSSRLGPRPRFAPIHIGRGRSRKSCAVSAAAKVRAALACACVIALGLGRLFSSSSLSSSTKDAAFPSPISAQGSQRPLLAEARHLAASERGPTLPGLASFLEHKAIQEALPYARVGEDRLDPFAPALMPLPSGGSGAAEGPLGVEFSDDWARVAYKSVPALSIEGMLLSQGSATEGREASSSGGGAGPLASIDVLLYILLLVPLCGRFLVGIPFARGAASGELRQEA